MEAIKNETNLAAPSAEINKAAKDTQATTPCVNSPQKQGGEVCVKFNKEIRTLSHEEAAVLAQKGLKYDMVSDDLKRLKNLAVQKGKNISDYITDIENQANEAHKKKLLDSCSGNSEIVEHILELEGATDGNTLAGLEEILREFPEIKSMSDLPSQVLETVEIKGGNLFDAYLRYQHQQNRQALKQKEIQQRAEKSSIGSQSGHTGGMSDVNMEFINGLWN